MDRAEEFDQRRPIWAKKPQFASDRPNHSDFLLGIINDLLRRLVSHIPPVTPLAAIPSHDPWGYKELAREWETNRAQVLRTGHNKGARRKP